MIVLVGLGPAKINSLSMAAHHALKNAERLYLRTARHPAAEQLKLEGVRFESFDATYEMSDTFDMVYDAIASRIIGESDQGDVVYAVPGHPLIAEESVRRILEKAQAGQIPVRIVGSSSFLEPVLETLQLSLDNVLILDAMTISETPPSVNLPMLIHQIYDRDVASKVKLALMKDYPDDWNVIAVLHAGVDGETVKLETPLHRLDRMTMDHLTTLYVPALPKELRKKSFDDLVHVMSRLRAEDGCPWDREQTHQSLKRYLIEECYEVIDAIDDDDIDELCEELGDVLLQVVFHSQIEAEEGMFTIQDVIESIVNKLIRRHPHVFGETVVADSNDVLRNWEKIKRSEKGEGWRKSALDGVPRAMPALMRAMEISKRAAKVGFEWENFDDVLSKLEEELSELREAIHLDKPEEIRNEIGDLLFTIVNIARWRNVDPEEALSLMLRRFDKRFRYVESQAREKGTDIRALTLAQMDELWEEAKRILPEQSKSA